ncbi:MAG: ABC transporter ATP-binding protein [Firmicutes bacterium]|nr:ABC transporter ATP-binding protein [Bacillota bacterium]
MKNAVELKNINFSFNTPCGEHFVLKDISFSVKEGEFISVAGPSGCGKSTLLSIISGLLKSSEGSVKIYDGFKCGYMLQKDYLFEWRNIFSNACLGAEINGNITEETKQYALSLFEKYGLKDYINSRPSALSGGMRQRVALIRTLVPKPDILLLDEPFSALDYQTRLEVCDEISQIIKNEGKTAIMVTHDISEAISVSDRVFVLSKIPAIIKSEHIIDISHSPSRRDDPRFREYFNAIWKELKDNE